jgi:protein-disulfide isomerase
VLRVRTIIAGVILAAGCRPSRAEFEAIERKLDAAIAQQEEILQRIDTAPTGDDAAALELIYDALTQIHRRIDDLEADIAPKAPVADDKPRAPGRPDPDARYRVVIGDAEVRGPSSALVTVVMWTDYQCPFSARVQPTLANLEHKYGEQIRFVHKHNPLPFHKQAMPAALAAEAAAHQGKFWAMHDALFENQRNLDDAGLRALAKKLKLDLGRFKRDLSSPVLQKKVKSDVDQATALGSNGTPAFFINGRFLSGAQPMESFEKLIDHELAGARKLVAQGVPAVEVYEVLIKDGRTAP